MDYVYGIQQALKYVEEHLEDKLDLEEISKRAFSSSFHFQRIFNAVCGTTIGEYIRNRRLSLAGSLLAKGEKVIDVAFLYGYNTPESFSRAFFKFHGYTPSEVKKGKPHKIYSPLSVKLIICGGTAMDYRFEQVKDFQVLVKKKRFTKDKEINMKESPLFWAESIKNGTIDKLVSYVHPQNLFKDSVIGIALEYKDGEKDFPYGIGVHYDGTPVKEEDFEIATVKEGTFIVFPIRGKMPDAFQTAYRYLFTEFFPGSEYYPTGVEIEAYPSPDVKNVDYACELWLSVAKK